MMSSRTLLKGAAIGHREPGDALAEVNNLLEADNDSAMFVTVFYAVYDPGTGTLTYANGGHNPPLVVHRDGSSSVLEPTGGIALGVAAGLPYEQAETHLEPGDIVVLYTDGVTEAMDPDNEEFGLERLQEVYAESPPTDAHRANDAAFEAVHAFAAGAPQSDDITCVTLMRI